MDMNVDTAVVYGLSAIGDWQSVISVLTRYFRIGVEPILAEVNLTIGFAICW